MNIEKRVYEEARELIQKDFLLAGGVLQQCIPKMGLY